MGPEIGLPGCRDADGYAPIGQYGVLGDGRGAALVAADGSVDWWAVPRLDSPPPFAALLDPDRGGRIELRPADPDTRATRRYLPDTNLLETTFRTAAGTVRITDSLNSGNAGALPWSELARRVEGIDGTVRLELVVRPGDGLRSWEPWAEDIGRGPVLHAGDLTMAVRCSPGIKLATSHAQAGAQFPVSAGERLLVGIVASHAEPLLMCDADAIDARLDMTAAAWRHWARQVRWQGQRREQVVRSALALKLLMMARTGAVAAAVTTSLPESIGGKKNWDYRFAWIRDAALTIDALAACGLQEEVLAAISWLLRAIRDNGPGVHVLYTLDGQVPASSRQAPVPGYKHSVPVMIGNTASSQTQLGVYGDLFGTVAGWVAGGHVLDTGSSRQLTDLADQCADTWRHDDSGIWELGTGHPYTSSKMNCWRALDAAAQLARAGLLTGTGQRWSGEADLIRKWVNAHCWSERKQAYTFYAGTDDLDASVLIGAQTGFDQGKRMSATIDAISGELGVGPLLYRYSGAQRQEQTFIACAYWRVHALACVGRAGEAQALMTELDAIASPLGLLTEMSAAGSSELIGNIPQALSHLAFIRAAAAVQPAGHPDKAAENGK